VPLTCNQIQIQTQKPSPGGDNPDDTFDVSTSLAVGEVSFEDWLRVAAKKEKYGALFFWQLRSKLDEFRNLPMDTSLVAREQKKRELTDLYSYRQTLSSAASNMDICAFFSIHCISLNDFTNLTPWRAK
jgi:hypothetical protein